MEPAEACKTYSSYLSQTDKAEIFKYKLIYYSGQNISKENKYRRLVPWKLLDRKNKKDKGNVKSKDADTIFQAIPGDHVAFRFEILASLGQGSFGQVFSAFDHKEEKKIAIKIVRRDIRFTKQAMEEVRILQNLAKRNKDPDGSSQSFPIVKMIEHLSFRDHACLTFELLGVSLYDLIKVKKGRGLPRDRVRRLMSSVLDGLCIVYDAGIIHCDLKPENILLIPNSHGGQAGNDADVNEIVKIIDFGSACMVNKQMYPYIQSRFYRAPEVILRLEYGQAIDMWSFGCLIFEMLRGFPLFMGEDEFDQMACIIEKLNLPPKGMLDKSRVFSRYFNDQKVNNSVSNGHNSHANILPRYCNIRTEKNGFIKLLPNLSERGQKIRNIPGSVPIHKALISSYPGYSKSEDDKALIPKNKYEEIDNKNITDLICGCLRWIPQNRLLPSEAKKMEWFTKVNLISNPVFKEHTEKHNAIEKLDVVSPDSEKLYLNIPSNDVNSDYTNISHKICSEILLMQNGIEESENKIPFETSNMEANIKPITLKINITKQNDSSVHSDISSSPNLSACDEVKRDDNADFTRKYSKKTNKLHEDWKKSRANIHNNRRFSQSTLDMEPELQVPSGNNKDPHCKTSTMETPDCISRPSGRFPPDNFNREASQHHIVSINSKLTEKNKSDKVIKSVGIYRKLSNLDNSNLYKSKQKRSVNKSCSMHDIYMSYKGTFQPNSSEDVANNSLTVGIMPIIKDSSRLNKNDLIGEKGVPNKITSVDSIEVGHIFNQIVRNKRKRVSPLQSNRRSRILLKNTNSLNRLPDIKIENVDNLISDPACPDSSKCDLTKNAVESIAGQDLKEQFKINSLEKRTCQQTN